MPFKGYDGYNEVEQPMTARGKIMKEMWISSPSVLTYKRLVNLDMNGLVGEDVVAFLPFNDRLANNLGEGFCAWSGPQAQ
uniref:Uncharacterized protein n=1 Tax=Cannabis sativa TaxID=3483 RepID=A0A803QBR8_CANSA